MPSVAGLMSIQQNKTMVSILVPIYNASQSLRQCVASLTGQTYTDLQIVLINDGSTDGSWNIMLELAQQDKRLEIYSQSNCGVAATRNRLLDKARGEFVLFVDSDDWIELDTVEVLMHEQQLYQCDMVVFNQPEDDLWKQEKAIKAFLRHREFRGMLWNKLIKRELFEKLFFNESVSFGEDALMIWNVLQRVKTVRVLSRKLYHYGDNENSLSRSTFDGRKFTAYTTWDTISTDTDELWPQYSDVAHARFACEMTQILRYAALSGYKRDESIKLLQEEVRRDGSKIKKTDVSSMKMRAYAWLISRHYRLIQKLSSFFKLR